MTWYRWYVVHTKSCTVLFSLMWVITWTKATREREMVYWPNQSLSWAAFQALWQRVKPGTPGEKNLRPCLGKKPKVNILRNKMWLDTVLMLNGHGPALGRGPFVGPGAGLRSCLAWAALAPRRCEQTGQPMVSVAWMGWFMWQKASKDVVLPKTRQQNWDDVLQKGTKPPYQMSQLGRWTLRVVPNQTALLCQAGTAARNRRGKRWGNVVLPRGGKPARPERWHFCQIWAPQSFGTCFC